MQTEYVSNDIFDEGYLKLFRPFRAIQMRLGSCRIDARDRFVTSPTKAQKLYTLFCILICTALYISIAFNWVSRLWPYQNIYYLNLTLLILHYATFVGNIFHVRFMNNDDNVKFYIKTQEIDRKLKINNNKCINNFLINSNFIIVVLMTIYISFLLFASALTQNGILFVSTTGLIFSQFSCTLEWLYCANLLIFFYIRLRYINAIITNHIEGMEDIKIDNIKNKAKFPTMKVLRFIASSAHDFKYSDTDIYLRDIFEEFIRFQNLYRFQIFLFCFKFVTSTLLVFEYVLLVPKNNIVWLEYVSLPTVTAVDLLIIMVVCVRCEAFAREIKKTKYLCTTVLSLYYGGPLRRKAIIMLKMIIEKPPRFSVYDMWNMDASTMIKMINLVTTLMVTLLQFALL